MTRIHLLQDLRASFSEGIREKVTDDSRECGVLRCFRRSLGIEDHGVYTFGVDVSIQVISIILRG